MFPQDDQYRLAAPHEPNELGHYIVRVYRGDDWLTSEVKASRDEAIEAATRYVAWHRSHDDAVEVIEL